MNHFWELTGKLLEPPYFRLLFAAVTAFLIAWFSIPSIIKTSRQKGLLYTANERSSHSGAVPALGGIAIFAAVGISGLLFLQIGNIKGMQYVLAGMIIVFLIGIKDDVSGLSAWIKLGGQIIACLAVILPGNLILTSLHGFMTVGEIMPDLGALLTLFVMIVIINSFNLIDGIDGLAGGIGILVFLTFGVWFYLAGHYEVAILAAAGVGALIAFLYFNVFGVGNKIFMGDGGSLMLGFMVAFFTILFNELNKNPQIPYHVYSAPSVSMGILVLPLYDTIRVFVIRALKGQSPFSADRSHVHHILIDIGLSHGKATIVLILFNIACIAFVFVLSAAGISVIKMMTILLLICFAGGETLNQVMLRKKRKTVKHDEVG
jgi:UDP-GlcNAc:undecaprenyl-phosphate/decaprenyl-phosphate GlcNAc-1-phosphate transferase